MKRILQIFTGGWNQSLHSSSAIIERIQSIKKRMPVDGLILGWSIEPQLYRDVCDYCRSRSIETYLWLPVFSEIPTSHHPDPFVNLMGTPASVYALQEGESFEFFCPSSYRNRQILLDLYDEKFSECGFDGVFLDKIRSPSFVTGLNDVLGCTCDSCRQVFDAGGCHPKDLKELIENHPLQAVFSAQSFNPARGFIFENPLVRQFFEVKKDLYISAIESIVDAFQSRGCKVGLDVFAPSLAALVGQDLSRLVKISDFIKPMIYRKTQAPAGIGFEMEAMEKALPDFNHDKLPS